jgi:hypothetical protein
MTRSCPGGWCGGRCRRCHLFAERAITTGAASILALQLYVEGDNLGALNLYARTPDAFTDESEQVGLLFAAHAASPTPAPARSPSSPMPGRPGPDRTGQKHADGAVQISGERTFLVLTRLSQTSNRKLYEVAAALVAQGTVAGVGADPTTPPRLRREP